MIHPQVGLLSYGHRVTFLQSTNNQSEQRAQQSDIGTQLNNLSKNNLNSVHALSEIVVGVVSTQRHCWE